MLIVDYHLPHLFFPRVSVCPASTRMTSATAKTTAKIAAKTTTKTTTITTTTKGDSKNNFLAAAATSPITLVFLLLLLLQLQHKQQPSIWRRVWFIAENARQTPSAAVAEPVIVIRHDDDDDTISRLVSLLKENLAKLGVVNTATTTRTIHQHPEQQQDDFHVHLERMAVLIHDSMSLPSRYYHSVSHVFEVAVDDLEVAQDPIAVLAALFHDVVYYHVDGGLTKSQLNIVKDALDDNGDGADGAASVEQEGDNNPNTMIIIGVDQIRKTAGPCEEETLLCMVEHIFGFPEKLRQPPQDDDNDGSELIINIGFQDGLNEFLSALIAVRELQKLHLPLHILAEIAGCIEATIPFRAQDAVTGKSYLDHLHDRLSFVNNTFTLGMPQNRIIKAVQRAAVLANADVGNVGSTDLLRFLDCTWKLLPETNEGLRAGRHFATLREFHFALFKIYGFFRYFIHADLVFSSFSNSNIPDIRKRHAQSIRNIEVGRRYVVAKVMSLSVLSAFAQLTGGDGADEPISLFTADDELLSSTLNNPDQQARQQNVAVHYDEDVYQILSKGRRSEMPFDGRQSPIAAYLHRMLGDDELENILSQVQVYPMTPDAARGLLQHLPRHVVQEVGHGLSRVAPMTRTSEISKLLKSLSLN